MKSIHARYNLIAISLAYLFLLFQISTTSDFDIRHARNRKGIIRQYFDSINPLDDYKTQTINITCITEKTGVGYRGFQNKAKDGSRCSYWFRYRDLVNRYINRGKNVTGNFCRNPDEDKEGPWCFVEKGSITKNKIKHCNIPLCVVDPVINMDIFQIGVPINMDRDCPTGFTKNEGDYCIARPDFLEKFPNGSYAFQVLQKANSSNCPPGFLAEKVKKSVTSMERIYCNKETTLNDTIDFPEYIKPEDGDLIFMAITFSNKCPSMRTDTSVVFRRFESARDNPGNICYYFYKLSKIKYPEDNRLGFFTFKTECPKGWTKKHLDFQFRLSFYQGYDSRSISMCYSDKDMLEYPEGNYCLISSTSSKQCPKEFYKITISALIRKTVQFCCRQTVNENYTNMDLFRFLNVTSVIIINNELNCDKDLNDSQMKVKSFTMESMFYGPNIQCNFCDLSRAINMSKRYMVYRRYNTLRISACNYERIINGFAYASINSRCPSGMEYAYIKYAAMHSYANKGTAIAKFCTVINYPSNISFPQGKYCIYKIGLQCPKDFVTNPAPLPMYSYKLSDSNGNIPNYNADSYCCKNGTDDIGSSRSDLPLVTNRFEFGLPFPNESYHCLSGFKYHTGVDDAHMCEYYPRTDNGAHNSMIFPSNMCKRPAYTFYGSCRLRYSQNKHSTYCYHYVKNNPPPGQYCIIFAKSCPNMYFDYITYHPLSQSVICCRKNMSKETEKNETTFTLSEWVSDLKEFHLLPYKGVCPIFRSYNYGKPATKVYNIFVTNDIGSDHKKNLTKIGVGIVGSNGYKVRIESCGYVKDPFNRSSTWPHGSYAFPKTLAECPMDFKSGYFTHSMESASPSFGHSDIIHLDGDYMIGGSTIKWGFCVKNDRYKKEKLLLPRGRYCLMKVGTYCPIGFSSGKVTFVEITAMNSVLIKRTGDLPEIDSNGPFITYHFCCTSGRGDVVHEPIRLPVDSGPFYLFKFGTYCQRVEEMRVTEEFICIDSEDSDQYLNYTFQAPYTIEGFTPVTGSYSRGCDFQINLCYYIKESKSTKTATPKPNQLQGWPKGSYVFVKALEQKCPALFDEHRISVFTKFKVEQRFLNTLMFGARPNKDSLLSYCERNSTTVDTSYPPETWPKGTYCVIFEKKCPQDMLRYKFKSIHNFVFTMSWEYLCCKKDAIKDSEELPFFPADQYSFLILPTAETHTCPAHKNMRVALINLQSEILCYYEKKDDEVELPDGDYLLPAPSKSKNRCPPGFKPVQHSHVSLSQEEQPSKQLKFCQREKNASEGQNFPRGNYCVLTNNTKCPSSQFTEESVLILPMFKFSDQENKLSRYLACCQHDDHIISNVVGMKVPFQMFGSTLCSYVDGMINANEVEELTNLTQRGIVERPPYIMNKKSIRLCRYDQSNVFDFDTKCHCHINAICLINFNGVKCKCKTGFFGDGKTVCSKVTNKTDGCGNACNQTRSLCVNTTIPNNYKCLCKEGYEGNGLLCKPSCNKRVCNMFSHCIVNEFESYCGCLSTSIKTASGSCHGDFLLTTSLLNGFEILNNLNLSCFSNETYNHLVYPNTKKTLFLFLSSNVKIDNNLMCKNYGNHYGLVDMKPPLDGVEWSGVVQTSGYLRLLVSVDRKKQWTINKEIMVNNMDAFTNTIVLYLNETLDYSWFGLDPSKKLVSKDSVIAGYLFGVLSIVLLVGVLVVCVLKRNNMFGFNRMRESRSETNIHFFSSDNKIEIDS